MNPKGLIKASKYTIRDEEDCVDFLRGGREFESHSIQMAFSLGLHVCCEKASPSLSLSLSLSLHPFCNTRNYEEVALSVKF